MQSTVSYMDPETNRPEIYLFDPPAGMPKQYPTVGHTVNIEDGRPQLAEFALDQHGFVLRADPGSVVADFHDQQQIEDQYYRRITELLLRETGATEVVIFDHTYRSSRELQPGEPDANTPVFNAHSDYTEATGPARAREVAGDQHAAAIDEKRYWIVNVWRSTNGVIEQKPLALCDLRSMSAEDFVPAKIRFPSGRNGGVMAIRHSDSHQWTWFPQMSSDEVLIFKNFDPRATGALRYGAHCTVEEPQMSGNEKIRESIEIRAVVIFDD